MITVGLTGGIGSGKTTVSRIFEILGVPIFSADLIARNILETDPDVRNEVIALLDERAFDENRQPDRAYIAKRVFENTDLLMGLNKIIHPRVGQAFVVWSKAHQEHDYVIHEAAVLYESGLSQMMDQIVFIYAPEELRVDRVVRRDGSSVEDVRNRMEHQWGDTEKAVRSQFIVVNDGAHSLIRQVTDIHDVLLAVSAATTSVTT